MKKIEELDSQCTKIFSVLAVNPSPMSFNKLFEKVKPEMAKPTLIRHLEHLRKHKVVTREKSGKQKVTYQLHEDCFDALDNNERAVIEKMNKETKKEIEIFNSLSTEDKVKYLLMLITLAQIDQLKNSLQMLSEPKEKFKFSMKTALTKFTLTTKIQYLLNNSTDFDLKEAVRQIDETEKYFWEKAALRRDIRDVF